MPDIGIDYWDAPTLTEDFWKTAELGRFYKPIKQQVTARLDADVLAWLKPQGKGYQARMNAILRRELLAAAKERRHACRDGRTWMQLSPPRANRPGVSARRTPSSGNQQFFAQLIFPKYPPVKHHTPHI